MPGRTGSMRTRSIHKAALTDAVTPLEESGKKLAYKAAVEGIVLLENDGSLPLKAGKIALYGAGAKKTIKGGTGSGEVNERHAVSVFEGLEQSGFTVTTMRWIEDYDQAFEEGEQEYAEEFRKKLSPKNLSDFMNLMSSPYRYPYGRAIQEKDIEESDTDSCIYVVSRQAGEGADRKLDENEYGLSEIERINIAFCAERYKKLIVVINVGGVFDLNFLNEISGINAVIFMGELGTMGGLALADVISGKQTPSGKLTDTWAKHYRDLPFADEYSYLNGNLDEEYYREGIYVGYRYFDTFDVPVRYGFGYGLSYTEFEISDYSLESVNDGKIKVSAQVKNIGAVSGKEVVQIYVSLSGGILEKEAHRLAAYAKTSELKPGESEKVSLEISVDQLTSYDEKRAAWILENGFYGIWIGNSLASAKLCGGVKLDKEVLLRQVKNLFPLKQELEEMVQEAGNTTARERAAEQQAQKENLTVVELHAKDFTTEVVEYKKKNALYEKEAMNFVDTLSEEELIDLAAGDPGKAQGGNLGAAGISVPGSAGETHRCAIDKGLASIVLADGPAGLRLMKYYHVNEGSIVTMPFEFSLEGGLFYDDSRELPGERYYQYCTAIPVGTLLAQTWNRALIREVGAMIGTEMKYFGVTLWLAPGMNIHRNPLCGRNFEYYSEDPYVAGTIAAAMTEGVQSNYGCGTTIKHFACNNQEDNRMGSDSVISERTLREVYLKGFEIAVRESQPLSIMTSYNLINGVHAANNYDLCTETARNEWGFKGMIMTDWTTTEVDEKCTASGCMRAGNDLVMPGCFGDHDNMHKELAEGTLKIEDLKACIARLVSVIWKSNQYLQ